MKTFMLIATIDEDDFVPPAGAHVTITVHASAEVVGGSGGDFHYAAVVADDQDRGRLRATGESDDRVLTVPLTGGQADAWRQGEHITINPAMQDGELS